MPRRPRRLLFLAIAALVGIASFGAHAWNVWPERTRDQLFALIRNGEFSAANRLIESPCMFHSLVEPPLPVPGVQIVALTCDPLALHLSASRWREVAASDGFAAKPRTLADRIAGRLVVEGVVSSQSYVLIEGNSVSTGDIWMIQPTHVTIVFERGRATITLEHREPQIDVF